MDNLGPNRQFHHEIYSGLLDQQIPIVDGLQRIVLKKRKSENDILFYEINLKIVICAIYTTISYLLLAGPKLVLVKCIPDIMTVFN